MLEPNSSQTEPAPASPTPKPASSVATMSVSIDDGNLLALLGEAPARPVPPPAVKPAATAPVQLAALQEASQNAAAQNVPAPDDSVSGAAPESAQTGGSETSIEAAIVQQAIAPSGELPLMGLMPAVMPAASAPALTEITALRGKPDVMNHDAVDTTQQSLTALMHSAMAAPVIEHSSAPGKTEVQVEPKTIAATANATQRSPENRVVQDRGIENRSFENRTAENRTQEYRAHTAQVGFTPPQGQTAAPGRQIHPPQSPSVPVVDPGDTGAAEALPMDVPSDVKHPVSGLRMPGTGELNRDEVYSSEAMSLVLYQGPPPNRRPLLFLGLFALVACGVIWAVVSSPPRRAQTENAVVSENEVATVKDKPPSPLQLKVESRDQALIGVRWDPQASAVATARSGRLVILESGKESRTVALDPAQLKSGHLYYETRADRVEFHMEVEDSSGAITEESFLALTPGSIDPTVPATGSEVPKTTTPPGNSAPAVQPTTPYRGPAHTVVPGAPRVNSLGVASRGVATARPSGPAGATPRLATKSETAAILP